MNVPQKSEIKQLLEKNAYGDGLTSEEQKRACQLIADPVFSKEDCLACKMSCPNDIKKAIFDIGLCQGHASYALVTRK
jgi:hypothetical protein